MNDILKLFIPHKGYVVTPLLLYINIGIFAAMVVSDTSYLVEPDTEGLMAWGANHRATTIGGDWWRLITCTFLHAGPIHLLGNMLSLFLAGLIIEPVVGSLRLLWMYLLCCLVASLASIGWYEDTPSVGASGAIIGMFGISLALMQKKVFPNDFIIVFLISVASSVGSGLLMGFVGEGVDNAAHLGGLVCGYLVGLPVAAHIANKRAAEQAVLAEQEQAKQLAYQQSIHEAKERKKQEELNKQLIKW